MYTQRTFLKRYIWIFFLKNIRNKIVIVPPQSVVNFKLAYKTWSLLDINFNSNWTRHSSNSITCWIAPPSFFETWKFCILKKNWNCKNTTALFLKNIEFNIGLCKVWFFSCLKFWSFLFEVLIFDKNILGPK